MSLATVRVPATTANLGPGYDAFGLALGLYNTFSAEPAGEWSVEVLGEGADTLRRDAENRVAKAMAAGLDAAGLGGNAARIATRNEIPPGRGLGSSAAAIVGGLMLADAFSEGALGRERVFELAVAMEGHPDNVAAALFGGFTIGWTDAGSKAVSIQPAGGLAAVVVIADWELSTLQARGMLPATLPHADAAFNAGRAGLVSAGLVLGRDDLLRAGLEDRLHEPYRSAAIPDFKLVTAALEDAGALGAVLSGAGPTVIGLVTGADDDAALDEARAVADRCARPLSVIGGRRAPLALRLDREGAALL